MFFIFDQTHNNTLMCKLLRQLVIFSNIIKKWFSFNFTLNTLYGMIFYQNRKFIMIPNYFLMRAILPHIWGPFCPPYCTKRPTYINFSFLIFTWKRSNLVLPNAVYFIHWRIKIANTPTFFKYIALVLQKWAWNLKCAVLPHLPLYMYLCM